jgi:probable phosphoglycerate mutase
MQARMVSTLDRLAAAHRGETIVAVSHADPIKAAVAHALGTHLDLFQRIVISPCSVSAILVAPGGPIVLAVNSTGDDLKALVPS